MKIEKSVTGEELSKQLSAKIAEKFMEVNKLYDDLMALCKESDSFYYVDHEKSGNTWLRVFTYRLASYSDFLKPGAMEARGIMFEVQNFSGIEGYERPTCIKSRPPAKFFNIGENPLTLELDYTRVKHSVIKEDGSLISTFSEAIWGMGEDFETTAELRLRLKSKTSTSSEQVKAAMAWLELHPEFRDALLELDTSGYTVNCEWCAPDNRIVVGYLERQLAAICARHYDKYTTYAGESLAGIAHRQLKDEDRWVEIEAANRHLYVHKEANDYYPAGAVILLPRTPTG